MKPKQQNRTNTRVPGNELTNAFFNVSQLKQRIQMLTKPTSPRRALWRYALVVPVAALLLMCTQTEKELDKVIKGREETNQSLKLAQVKGEIFTVVEHQPEFKGGMSALTKYMSENLRYPAEAQKNNIEGRVFLRFIVTTEGKIADVSVLKGLGYGCDEEAIRVLSRMPDWEPGRQGSTPVNVLYNIPINFQLNDKSPSKAENKTSGWLRPLPNEGLVAIAKD